MLKEVLKFITIFCFITCFVFGIKYFFEHNGGGLFKKYKWLEIGVYPKEYNQMREHKEYCPLNISYHGDYRTEDIFYPDDDCSYYNPKEKEFRGYNKYSLCKKSHEIYKVKGLCDTIINEVFIYKTAKWDLNFSPRYKVRFVSSCSATDMADCKDEGILYIEKQLKTKYGF